MNTIVCIGDSITKGKVWRENERRPYITNNSYPVLLENMTGTQVLNNGICDITSEQLLKYIQNDISIENNNTIIVEVGGNDCNLNWKEIKKDPDGFHDAKILINVFTENLLKIVDLIKKDGALPILCTLPPLDAEKYYNLLKRVFGEGIKRWIDRNGGIFRWQERYSDVIKETALRTGTYLIDVRKSFMDTIDYRNFISYDGIHPTEEGYMLIADTCSKYLKKLGQDNSFSVQGNIICSRGFFGGAAL